MKSSWKRLWMLVSVLVLVGGIAACGNGDDEDDTPEEDAPEQEIYFYNSEEWDEVYAYSEDVDALSEEPGLEAEEEGEGWYYVTVERDVLRNPMDISFNNGDGEEGATLTIDHPRRIYTTINEEGVFGSKGGAEDSTSDEFTTVYFYNEEGWDTVNAYAWNDASTLTSEWPGDAAEEADRENWYKYDIQNAEPGDLNVIFNNDDVQTGDIAIPDEDNVYVVFDGNEVVTDTYTSFEAAEEGAAQVTTEVFFYNDQGWDNVEASASTPDETLLDSEAATQDGDTDWWSVEVPVEIEETTFDIEFSDGDQNTGDTITLDSDSNLYLTADSDTTYEGRTQVYFSNENDWSDVYADLETDVTTPEAFLTDVETFQEDDSDWYMADIPVNFGDNDYHITFHDGDGNEAETASLTETGNRYFTMSADEAYSTLNQAEAWMNAADEDFLTIYFYNSEDWSVSDMNAYNWSTVDDLNEILGSWPGTSVEQDTDDSDWVTIDVPVDLTDLGDDDEFNIIFNDPSANDGDGAQTPDILLENETDVYLAYNGNTYADKAAAEEAMVRTEVSFYNTEDWDTVYANAETGDETLLDSAEATQDDDTDWWTVEVPADIKTEDFDITFHDGDGNEATTTSLTDGDPLVLNMDGISDYETRELTELYYEADTSGYNTVYFYNSEDWTNVNAYTFGDDHGELYGGWPGSPLMESDSADWYEIGGPVDFADDEFTVIFNADQGQSENIELTSNDDVYIVLDGNTDDSGNYTVEKYTSESDAEDAVAAQ